MKVTIDVPQTFEITLKQIDDFLIGSGWGKQDFTDNLNQFQCGKYPNVFATLPKKEGQLLDEEPIIISALSLIANVNNNCGIGKIIDRIAGVK